MPTNVEGFINAMNVATRVTEEGYVQVPNPFIERKRVWTILSQKQLSI